VEEQRRKPQITFCVSVKIQRYSDTLPWVSFSSTLRMLELYIWEQSGTLLQEQGSHDRDVMLSGSKDLPKPTCIGAKKKDWNSLTL